MFTYLSRKIITFIMFIVILFLLCFLFTEIYYFTWWLWCDMKWYYQSCVLMIQFSNNYNIILRTQVGAHSSCNSIDLMQDASLIPTWITILFLYFIHSFSLFLSLSHSLTLYLYTLALFLLFFFSATLSRRDTMSVRHSNKTSLIFENDGRQSTLW